MSKAITNPVDIQLFAEDSGKEPGQAEPQNPQQPAPKEIDYSKIQQMLDGTLAAKEDTALKAYFKQQGLSPDEMTQAINSYKEQKAAQQPDIDALQQQLQKSQQMAQKAELEKAATIQALALGVDIKTVPYLIKMADFSTVTAEDGAINAEGLTAALNKVLEDIPALKPVKEESKGFRIGAGSSGQQPPDNNILADIFGNTKG